MFPYPIQKSNHRAFCHVNLKICSSDEIQYFILPPTKNPTMFNSRIFLYRMLSGCISRLLSCIPIANMHTECCQNPEIPFRMSGFGKHVRISDESFRLGELCHVSHILCVRVFLFGWENFRISSVKMLTKRAHVKMGEKTHLWMVCACVRVYACVLVCLYKHLRICIDFNMCKASLTVWRNFSCTFGSVYRISYIYVTIEL